VIVGRRVLSGHPARSLVYFAIPATLAAAVALDKAQGRIDAFVAR